MPKCMTCKKRKATPIGHNLTFVRDGLTFYIPVKTGGECRQCAEDDAWERFNKYGRRLIDRNTSARGFSVNWRYFVADENADNSDTHVSILESLGVLAFEIAGNWAIFDGPYTMFLLPSTGITYFFTDGYDAANYAKAKYGSAQFGYVVAHIDKIVTS